LPNERKSEIGNFSTIGLSKNKYPNGMKTFFENISSALSVGVFSPLIHLKYVWKDFEFNRLSGRPDLSIAHFIISGFTITVSIFYII
jgi:hypothetical protein